MRFSNHNNNTEAQEDGHYWISISDLMTSLLFIFILILAYTILTFSEKSEAFEANFKHRQTLLHELKTELKKKNVDVDIDPQNGNMRIRSDTFFAIGSADLSIDGKQKLEIIAKLIVRKMNSKNYRNAIDTIFIEGHTDNTPISNIMSGRRWTNMELSAQRAINTFIDMDRYSGIKEIKNSSNKYLFSYSGYADQRPIASNNTMEGKSKNRRIEFFFALLSPKAK